MKRALVLSTAFLLCTAAVQAQSKDPHAPLRNYASRVLPKCPGGVLTLEPLAVNIRNFNAYQVTVRSSDQYCGTQKYLLHSPTTQQVLIGSVIPIPASRKPSNERVAEEAGKLLKKELTVTVAPFPLPDGLRAVTMTRPTPFGPFAMHGFLDAAEEIMVVGWRGNLKTDPAATLRQTLQVDTQVKRGKKDAAVEIIEISDFQCPTCALAHEKVEPIIKKGLGNASYVRIDLPLFEHHQWAIPAAAGARAIQKVAPSKYWTYVDYIFKNQEAIGKQSFDKVIEDFAADNDIDWAALKPLYSSKAERQALLEQVSRAYSLGIASTPTFIVNGQVMGFGPSGEFTMAAIKEAIGASAKATPAAAKKAAPAKKKK